MAPETWDQLIRNLNEYLYLELDRHLRAYMVAYAASHPIPGMDFEDVLQELRIAMWTKVEQGKFDPEKSKPVTYFSWVFRTTVFNLGEKARRPMRQALTTTDSLDEMMEREGSWGIGNPNFVMAKYLRHDERHVFCDRCSRIIDPHTAWIELPSGVACERCVSETAASMLPSILGAC